MHCDVGSPKAKEANSKSADSAADSAERSGWYMYILLYFNTSFRVGQKWAAFKVCNFCTAEINSMYCCDSVLGEWLPVMRCMRRISGDFIFQQDRNSKQAIVQLPIRLAMSIRAQGGRKVWYMECLSVSRIQELKNFLKCLFLSHPVYITIHIVLTDWDDYIRNEKWICVSLLC